MRSVYEIGPDFELSPKVLEFEKNMLELEPQGFTMGRTELKPAPKSLHYKKNKKNKNKIKTDTEGSL